MSDELTKLMGKLKCDNPEERECALDGIGELNPPNAFELIVPFLSDDDAQVRGTAACNLGIIRDRQAVPVLINAAERDPSGDVKAEALGSLAEYQDAKFLKLSDEDELLSCLLNLAYAPNLPRRARQQVAKQLGRFACQESAAETLRTLIDDDPDAFVRDFAVASLQNVQTEKAATYQWQMASESQSPNLIPVGFV